MCQRSLDIYNQKRPKMSHERKRSPFITQSPNGRMSLCMYFFIMKVHIKFRRIASVFFTLGFIV